MRVTKNLLLVAGANAAALPQTPAPVAASGVSGGLGSLLSGLGGLLGGTPQSATGSGSLGSLLGGLSGLLGGKSGSGSGGASPLAGLMSSGGSGSPLGGLLSGLTGASSGSTDFLGVLGNFAKGLGDGINANDFTSSTGCKDVIAIIARGSMEPGNIVCATKLPEKPNGIRDPQLAATSARIFVSLIPTVFNVKGLDLQTIRQALVII
jgi:hypothetical protein